MAEPYVQDIQRFYRIYFNKMSIQIAGYAGFAFHSVDSYLHQHMDFYELILITHGNFYHDYDSKTETVNRRDLMMFKPGTVHRIHCQPLQAIHFVICIRKDFFEDFVQQHFPDINIEELPDYMCRSLPEYVMAHIENIAHILCETTQQRHVADTITYNMLSNLFYSVGSKTQDRRYDYVDDIISTLNNPVYLNLTVDELCRRYPVSRPTILKNFKKQTGYSVVEYKAQRRLAFAAHLLEDDMLNLTVTDVCNNLGYDSLSYFLRAFKKKYGVTPTEYRKRYHENS